MALTEHAKQPYRQAAVGEIGGKMRRRRKQPRSAGDDPARNSSGSCQRRNVALGAAAASKPASTTRASEIEAPVGAARISRLSTGPAASLLAAEATPMLARPASAARRDS